MKLLYEKATDLGRHKYYQLRFNTSGIEDLDKVCNEFFTTSDASFIQNHLKHYFDTKALAALYMHCQKPRRPIPLEKNPLHILNAYPEIIKPVIAELSVSKLLQPHLPQKDNTDSYFNFYSQLILILNITKDCYDLINLRRLINRNPSFIDSLHQSIISELEIPYEDNVTQEVEFHDFLKALEGILKSEFFADHPLVLPNSMDSVFIVRALFFAPTVAKYLTIEHVLNLKDTINYMEKPNQTILLTKLLKAIIRNYLTIIDNSITGSESQKVRAKLAAIILIYVEHIAQVNSETLDFFWFEDQYCDELPLLHYLPFYFDCFNNKFELNGKTLPAHLLSVGVVMVFDYYESGLHEEIIYCLTKIPKQIFIDCFTQIAIDSEEDMNYINSKITAFLKNFAIPFDNEIELIEKLQFLAKFALVNISAEKAIREIAQRWINEYIKCTEDQNFWNNVKETEIINILHGIDLFSPFQETACRQLLQQIHEKFTSKKYLQSEKKSLKRIQAGVAFMKSYYGSSNLTQILCDEFEEHALESELAGNPIAMLNDYYNIIVNPATKKKAYHEASLRIAEFIFTDNAKVTSTGEVIFDPMSSAQPSNFTGWGLTIWEILSPKDKKGEKEKEKEPKRNKVDNQQSLTKAIQALEFVIDNDHPNAMVLKNQILLITNNEAKHYQSNSLNAADFKPTLTAISKINKHYGKLISNQQTMSPIRLQNIQMIIKLTAEAEEKLETQGEKEFDAPKQNPSDQLPTSKDRANCRMM